VSGRRAARIGYELVLVVAVLLFLYPFYAVITLGLKSPEQALYNPMSLPTQLYLENFKQAWKLTRFPEVFVNSVIVTGAGSLGISVLSALASFTIARRRNIWTTGLYFFFLSGLLIPYYMTLSPLIKLMRDMRLINSLWGLSVAYMGRGIPFAAFLYVGFIRTIPGEIMDSGVVDGCTPIILFGRIVAPMISHITTTLTILNVLWIWNDFLFPLLTLQSVSKRTIPMAQFVFHGSYATSWNLVFASYLLSMAPLVLLYFFLQRYVVEGITAGALKG
jgi:raffinose/stachyose/melibiose transport system permease protein